jgi:hypothetical protein
VISEARSGSRRQDGRPSRTASITDQEPASDHRPAATHLGWWAVGLTAAFFLLVFAAILVPRGAALGFVSGLAGAIVALMAIIRERERAMTVFAALVPLAIAVAFVLAELISGNP